MPRRFPLTTPQEGGSTRSAGPFRAIAPATLGDEFATIAYQSVTGSWYERAAFTIGILHYPLDIEGGIGTSRWIFQAQGNGGSQINFRQVANAFGQYEITVGTDTYYTNYSAGTGTAGTGSYYANGTNASTGMMLTVIVCDDDAYPDDRFMINGKNQAQSGSHVLGGDFNGWSYSADVGPNHRFRLGDLGAGSICKDAIAGVFYHYDAMSDEEVKALMMNVSIAKDIPNVDYTGVGVVPDHIWSVKRNMQVGTNGILSWSSDGATGGEVLGRVDDTLQVVEFDINFNAM